MIELDETQIAAIEFATSRRFAIIQGGAGTGKTTIIKEIAARCKKPKLCAFAGKAAARLKEATGIDASTIHRMLQFQETRFALETLRGSTVIVDEASMVSCNLMAEIMKRDPDRLILVGDEAQLPPVGKGQPFHDLIRYKPDCCAQLTKCYRNTEAVFKAATRIRNGETPERHERSANEEWTIVQYNTPEATQEAILQAVKNGDLDFATDIVLCPRNGDNDDQACTVRGLNKAIVDIVNPRDGDEKFRVGDRVINTKNYSASDVWNGTTGTISNLNQSSIWVKLDIPVIDYDRTTDPANPVYKDIVEFDKDMRKTLQLAYALSVHKSQGSQYRRVVFCCLERDSFMLLTRSLIYTAVTRTKEMCIVSGSVRALINGTNKIDEKRTIIQEFATA